MGDLTQFNQDWTSRTCPNCLEPQNENEEYFQSGSPAEACTFDEVKRRFIGLGNGTQFFSYVRCSHCNLLYNPIYFGASQLADCYSEMPDNLMGAEKKTASVNQEAYAKQILAELKHQPQSYLEIGPDVGLLAHALQDISKIGLIYLVEPNRSVHNHLRQNLEPGTIKEIVSNLQESSAMNIDLCVGIHVLDHLLNPREELSMLNKIIKNGGVLALVVHNEKSLLRRIMRDKWPPFCLQHPQLFNRTTANNLLSNNGFEVLSIHRTRNYIRFDNAINNVFEVFGIKSKVPTSKYWPNLSIYFGNILIISRKVE